MAYDEDRHNRMRMALDSFAMNDRIGDVRSGVRQHRNQFMLWLVGLSSAGTALALALLDGLAPVEKPSVFLALAVAPVLCIGAVMTAMGAYWVHLRSSDWRAAMTEREMKMAVAQFDAPSMQDEDYRDAVRQLLDEHKGLNGSLAKTDGWAERLVNAQMVLLTLAYIAIAYATTAIAVVRMWPR